MDVKTYTTFEDWFTVEKDSDTLQNDFEEYIKEQNNNDMPIIGFKHWAKSYYEMLKKYGEESVKKEYVEQDPKTPRFQGGLYEKIKSELWKVCRSCGEEFIDPKGYATCPTCGEKSDVEELPIQDGLKETDAQEKERTSDACGGPGAMSKDAMRRFWQRQRDLESGKDPDKQESESENLEEQSVPVQVNDKIAVNGVPQQDQMSGFNGKKGVVVKVEPDGVTVKFEDGNDAKFMQPMYLQKSGISGTTQPTMQASVPTQQTSIPVSEELGSQKTNLKGVDGSPKLATGQTVREQNKPVIRVGSWVNYNGRNWHVEEIDDPLITISDDDGKEIQVDREAVDFVTEKSDQQTFPFMKDFNKLAGKDPTDKYNVIIKGFNEKLPDSLKYTYAKKEDIALRNIITKIATMDKQAAGINTNWQFMGVHVTKNNIGLLIDKIRDNYSTLVTINKVGEEE